MLVKRGQHVRPIDATRPPTGPLKPAGHGRPRGDPRGFGPEKLGHRYSGLGGAPHQAGIHVVVKITDLDRLGHGGQVYHAISHVIMRICKRVTEGRDDCLSAGWVDSAVRVGIGPLWSLPAELDSYLDGEAAADDADRAARPNGRDGAARE